MVSSALENKERILTVLEHVQDVTEGQLGVMIGFADILGQLGAQEIPFLVREPVDIFGEIRHEKKADYSRNGSRQTLEDEHPSPTAVTTDTVHLTDSSGKDTAKGTGKSGGAEEKTEALLRLAASIPHTHEVKTCQCQLSA